MQHRVRVIYRKGSREEVVQGFLRPPTGKIDRRLYRNRLRIYDTLHKGYRALDKKLVVSIN